LIDFQDVHFKREDKVILHDISWQVGAGEHWVILGRNGSGKTTMLEMINGYLFPSSGRITVLGNRYGACDVREVRKKIGYISQTLLEKLTLRDPVWEVVATGALGYLRLYEQLAPEIIEKAHAMLDFIQLGKLRDQPLGAASQGERKKIMLARALMTDPTILILDEPCSGLDLYEREQLLEQINVLGGKVQNMVYVTHHIEEIVPVFSHVTLIEQGQIVAAGEKQQVLIAELLQRAFDVPVQLEWSGARPWIKVV
jgi:iron complex transport system ATP-binding protein